MLPIPALKYFRAPSRELPLEICCLRRESVRLSAVFLSAVEPAWRQPAAAREILPELTHSPFVIELRFRLRQLVSGGNCRI
ncbi:MAG TPA: hypothetical protein DIT89_13945 [Planctomycetaceae bacterium]|nr:hypothetical protein [Planctomycetaceae bacterium]